MLALELGIGARKAGLSDDSLGWRQVFESILCGFPVDHGIRIGRVASMKTKWREWRTGDLVAGAAATLHLSPAWLVGANRNDQ